MGTCRQAVAIVVLACAALLGTACRRERKLAAEDVGVFVGAGMFAVNDAFDRMGTPEHPLSSRDVGTVVLQFKDSDGALKYDSAVPARHGLSFDAKLDLDAVINVYRSRGFRVIGYLQVFKDAAFANAHPSEAVRDATGVATFRDGYGAFIDPASTLYASYFLDLVKELSSHPIDELMLDYIRYPEYEEVRFPHSANDLTTRAQTIASFVGQVRGALDPKIRLSTAVFAQSKGVVAQDCRLLCPIVDVISPMIYPSLPGAPRGLAWTEIYDQFIERLANLPKSCIGKIRPFLQGYAETPVRGDDNQLPVELMRYQLVQAARSGLRNVLVFNSRSRYSNLVTAMD
ncbi:MAG: hypothetical protein H0V17_19290 [Deltaproteobacteria bacterium]|nr:hypothetical protein [Deltaproteobacteria bacterium]